MKKIVIIIIAIVFIIIAIIGYKIYDNNYIIKQSNNINSYYENFYNVQVLGTDIASLINKIDDSNNKNNIEKDDDGNYIENNKNSIKLEIKFLELDNVITSEKVEAQGINQFVQNFGALSFKCTKIEYHNSTHQIKHMYFEQI